MSIAKGRLFKVSFILLFILSIFILLVSSCSIMDNWVNAEEYERLNSEYKKLSSDYKKLEEEDGRRIDELKKEVGALERSENQQYREKYFNLFPAYINNLNEYSNLLEEKTILEKEVSSLEDQPQLLKSLLEDLNSMLSNVYYGIAENENGYSFTAFAIEYNGNHYMITAGHCINDNFGSSGKFKFKANFSDNWIYPELLAQKHYFWNLEDYAIFTSEKIRDGLNVGSEPTDKTYALGSAKKNLSVFRNIRTSSKRGESGSPIINEFGEVIGILVVAGRQYTPIELVTEKIDEELYGDQ